MKIPVEILVSLGAKGIEIVKKNPTLTISAVNEGKKILEKLLEKNDTKSDRFQEKLDKKRLRGKLHYRKDRYLYYQNEILPNISNLDYLTLDENISEVESFIKQLKAESVIVNKPLIKKRQSNWIYIHNQLKDKRDNNLYFELVKLNNDPSYQSGFIPKNVQEHFNELTTLEERKDFVALLTNKEASKINKDFLR